MTKFLYDEQILQEFAEIEDMPLQIYVETLFIHLMNHEPLQLFY